VSLSGRLFAFLLIELPIWGPPPDLSNQIGICSGEQLHQDGINKDVQLFMPKSRRPPKDF
jgi:hypothetical protein